MHRRTYPWLCLFLAMGIWMALDCEGQANPLDAATTLAAPAPAGPARTEELTDEEKALLDFLQNEGMAGLILYGGYVITPPPTGLIDPPKDPPKDNSGNPPGPPEDPPPDPPDDPPQDSPEPGTLVLGLLGLGVTSVVYTRRRKKMKAQEQTV